MFRTFLPCAECPSGRIAHDLHAIYDTTAGICAPEAIPASAKRTVYTAQGIRLHDDATDAEIRALAPGLYIIAGKKVIVR